MSPFSKQLQQLRKSYGLRQKELANAVGCEPCYISQMERDTKGPPTAEFVKRIIDALSLSQEEQDKLQIAIDASQRKLIAPAGCNEDVYWLLRDLRLNLKDLMPMQICLIREIIGTKNNQELNDRFLCNAGHVYQQENGIYG
ncbi:helix-turn-helix transcriptional regulator [Iodobacter sp. LRB]|uniref:helix-turn-helix domain-containing protein n=1 Tax=unclassified Iodobacter TaxID=235634 RepID=UPI000C11F227|nr:helix-turn-helix transcriptional regulator [Iodobacter sp. BJB302]PHU99854.1 transcriptional regulator [Iodobacter sp. BJB302]